MSKRDDRDLQNRGNIFLGIFVATALSASMALREKSISTFLWYMLAYSISVIIAWPTLWLCKKIFPDDIGEPGGYAWTPFFNLFAIPVLIYYLLRHMPRKNQGTLKRKVKPESK